MNRSAKWAASRCFWVSAYGKIVFGFHETGDLFSLNTATGETQNMDSIYSEPLPSKVWRTLKPTIRGKTLYAGTNKGELYMYDTGLMKTGIRINVTDKDGFYTNPVLIGKDIYLVSNKGKIFRIIKNDT